MKDQIDCWARPGQQNGAPPEPLSEHASKVASHTKINTPKTTTLTDGTPLRPLLRTLAWTHDIGKATTWFQEKIENETAPTVDKPRPNADTHSPLGGPVAWQVCQRAGFSRYSSLLAATVVARHHGTIPDVSQYFFDHLLGDNERWELISLQARNISQFASKTGTHLIENAWEVADEKSATQPPTWGEVSEGIAHGGIREEMWKSAQSNFGSGLAKPFTHDRLYDDLFALWGGLKAADTLAAAGSPPHKRQPRINSDDVENHVKSLPEADDQITTTLNQARESARQNAIDAAVNSGGDPGVYTLTLPTGAGKTLTGTQTALRLREEYGAVGPVIYALPYTSIIDQTASTFESVFNTEYPSSTLNVHHHLAPTDSDTELPTAEQLSQLSRDSWQADLTLTTFVQLWESLAGPRQAQATKLPALYDSTIILDEPQALPLAWWPAIGHLFDTLTTDYSARIILMSATQPRFNFEQEPTPLTAKPEISIPDRTQFTLTPSLQPDSEPLDTHTAATQICAAIENGASSILSIQNTVASTLAMADELKSQLSCPQKSIHDIYSALLDTEAETLDTALPTASDLSNAVLSLPPNTVLVCTLTTRHRPCDRQIITNALKQILEKVNEKPEATPTVVAVTTQLVEAGVDISFEYLFRDFAPYDSLIQAAGRCNRNYEFGKHGGVVTIWKLNNSQAEATRLPCRAVYGANQDTTVNRLSITQKVIGHISEMECENQQEAIPESTITRHHEDYQRLLRDHRPDSSEISAAIKSGDGDRLTRASIIEERPSVPVIISRTNAGDKLIRQYQKHIAHFEFEKADTALHQLRQLQTNIPPCGENERSITEVAHQLEHDLYALTSRQTKTTDAYPVNIGAQHPTDTIESRFL